MRACVCLADCALTPCLGLRRPWLPGLAPGQLCPWPSPQPPGPDEAGLWAPGWQTAGPAPQTGLSAGPVCLPAPHTCAQSSTICPLPSRPGLSPVFDQVASGGPESAVCTGSPPPAGRIHCGPSAFLLLCIRQRLERSGREWASRGRQCTRNPLQPGLVSPVHPPPLDAPLG